MARPPVEPYSTCTSEFERSAMGGSLKVLRLAPRALRIGSRPRSQPARDLKGEAGPEGNPEPGAGVVRVPEQQRWPGGDNAAQGLSAARRGLRTRPAQVSVLRTQWGPSGDPAYLS